MAFLSRFSRNGTKSPSRGSREERNNHPILSVFELERLLYTGKTACNHADEVWPGLYLGDQDIAANRRELAHLRITHILNASHSKWRGGAEYYEGTGIRYLGIEAHDSPSFDMSPYFYPAADFIHQALNEGCFCSLGLIYTNKSCTMPPITFQDLPLNIYMVIFGTGIFVFVLSLIFCCYFISKLRHQAQSERFGYKEVVLKGDARKLNVHGTCAVCLEDFRVREELGVLPCQHAFHRKCLVKWLEVRCVCPMCNKPMAGGAELRAGSGTLLDELV
ncbi:RING finger protein 122 isoform X2 [Struthio camelus]|uniref:RING finger protein 122 isoform X2 n=1 Tax=Struthio camelus TaxID=8801 RepID=UPI003603D082